MNQQYSQNTSVQPQTQGYYGYNGYPQPTYFPQQPQRPAAPKRKYSAFESTLAWLCLLVGFLFCRVAPATDHPFGGFLLVFGVYIATFIFLAAKRIKVSALKLVMGISGMLMALPLIITTSDFIVKLSFGYSVIVYLYFLYSLKTGKKKFLRNYLIIDLFKVLFVLPFYSFVSIFRAMFSGKGGLSGKLILKIVLGIAIAIIPTAIILALLSYDEAFMEIIRNIFDFTAYDVFLFVVDIGFAVPIGMYLFGLYISCDDGINKKIIPAATCKSAFKKLQIAPSVTAIVAIVPIVIVYILFFISQWQYFVSGFTGELPDRFSYSGYAREGFFQLCVVSVINLVLVLAVALFAKRKQGKRSKTLSVIAITLSVCTLILIATAIAKMVMYIDFYGLTPKRVYATWFMVFLAVVFLLVIIGRFIRKIKVIALSLAVFSVMLIGLSIPFTDRLIARYNVDRNLAGTIDEIDYASMYDLGLDGVPEFVRLYRELPEHGKHIDYYFSYENQDDSTYFDLLDFLRGNARYLESRKEKVGIFSFSISEKAAEEALRSIGYMD